MASLKELQGVAHNIAHHSQSSMSWLHPHLGQACHLAGVSAAEVELLSAKPYPLGLPTHELLPSLKPLELALQGLQTKFWEILKQQGLCRADISSVRLEFHFGALPRDAYLCSVAAVITATTGKVFQQSVPFVGSEKGRY